MIFKEGAPVYSSEIDRVQGEEVLYINFMGANFVPNLAGSPEIMARLIDLLAENPNVSRVVFVQQRNYNFSFEAIELLSEIARIYNFLIKQESVLSVKKLSFYGNVSEIHSWISYIMAILKQDPLLCYSLLGKKIDKLKKLIQMGQKDKVGYLRLLEKIINLLEDTKIIKKILSDFQGYNTENREIYDFILRPDILPNFSYTRLMAQFPKDAEMIDQYEVGNEDEQAIVTILKVPDESKYYYHLMPPEYNLQDDYHKLLNLARNVLIEHRPKADEFTDPDKTRNVFFNVAKDLLGELAETKKIFISNKWLDNLAKILVRYTIGFGLIEVILMDKNIQDLVMNAPIAQNPMFVRHEKYEECYTNIIPSYEDAESWAAKLRMQSGRPLDESNPVLDSDLVFGNIRARVAAVKEPLSPLGISYALRRHRDEPWTLPLFIKNKMINSLAAGLLSFLVDGNRTLLVAGTRSSGKTSLLGSLMFEIMPKFRVITVEDTLELPIDSLRKNGYNILRMKVRSSLSSGTSEIEASEGIRTSLRLGDSALIVGEVRSDEAKSLYEAMRVGALANVVAGTIHGDSPYGVFDRVVNDIGIPATSFKATDLILMANPVKSADGLHSKKRLINITEVRKHWINDPLEEGGFVDLLTYNVEKDEIEPSQELMNGDSEIIKKIAGNVKGWAGNWDAVYDNILLRAKIKQELVEASEKLKKPEIIEAKFNVLANNAFHSISDNIRKEIGLPEGERVFPEWRKWLYDNVKKARI